MLYAAFEGIIVFKGKRKEIRLTIMGKKVKY